MLDRNITHAIKNKKQLVISKQERYEIIALIAEAIKERKASKRDSFDELLVDSDINVDFGNYVANFDQ